MLMSKLQQDNVKFLSLMDDPLCDWQEDTGRTATMLTCFFVHAEEDVVVVPQSRYRPSDNDWHSVDEKLKWEDEHPNPRTITFYTEGRFGVNLEEALYGRQEAVGVSVDGEDDVDPNLALHILWPGCSPCCMPVVCESASETKDDEIVDFAVLIRAVAEKMLVLIEDRPQIIDNALYCKWSLPNVQLKDITLLQLKNVSHKNGWQPVLAIKTSVGESDEIAAFPPLDDIPAYGLGIMNPVWT